MRYLLLIYEPERPPESEIDPAAAQAEMAAYGAFTQEVKDRGLFEGGEALQPSTTATSVRVRDSRAETTDGPFAEAKEVLGGFYLLDCRDLDEATELAAKIPAVNRGTIEIRPIWEWTADQDQAAQAEPAHAV
jgi:hypothetical protein